MKAILHLTKNCNLRCRYCYAPAKIKEDMPEDVAQKGIDLVVAMGKKSACVSYFGGEPLLLFDRIRRLTDYALEAGLKARKSMHFRLSTNGTLFTEEILRYCRDNRILYAISLDGDQKAHDANRKTADGRGSFEKIDSMLDMVLEYNPYSVFTTVITPLNAGRLRQSMEYMWSRGIRYVVHQPDFTDPEWTMEDFDVLRRSYEEVAAWYIEKTRSGEYFFLNLFDDKLKSHARARIKLGEICDFGARKISIAPDGNIYPCVQFVSDREDARNFRIGHVDTGLTPRREELIAENKRERSDCVGCAHLGRCSNYCGCLNWQVMGEVTQVPPIVCEHERMLIPIADEIGNILWKEKDRSFLNKHYRYLNKELEDLSHYAFD